MEINGSTALVTGANRGLGKAYIEAPLAAGAAKVYAGARDPATINDSRVTPLALDVPVAERVERAASTCPDVSLLINNAGAMLATPILSEGSDAALRREMEVNVFGMPAMARAFAPVLAGNGGGVIVNMLSVVSWYVYPFNATYCASKHAALAVTNALRIQLKAQGTEVIGVYAGFSISTWRRGLPLKRPPRGQVAERTLDGIRLGHSHVHADNAAENLWAKLRNDPEELEAWAQQLWDEGRGWTTSSG